jgi:metallo-beta-lactamase family protein
LAHAHIDHCGLLPKLVRDGFTGRIYGITATTEIAEIMLLGSTKLQKEDAEFKKERHLHKGRRSPIPEIPLYAVDDAGSVFPLFAAGKIGPQNPPHSL